MPDPVLTGGCVCGAVRYAITAPLTTGVYCHCTRCQRRTGCGASANAPVTPGSFHLTSGEEHVRAWRPPDGAEKCFCARCGSALFSRATDDPERIGVRLGGIDGDPGIRMGHRQFVADAAVWEPIPDDGLPRTDGRARLPGA